jgi:hypothetical protein
MKRKQPIAAMISSSKDELIMDEDKEVLQQEE